MGVPAISTNVSAIPELIQDNATGIIIAPEDSKAMAEAIENLLRDSVLRQKIIAAGKKQVAEHFDNIRLTANLGDIFQKHSPLRHT